MNLPKPKPTSAYKIASIVEPSSTFEDHSTGEIPLPEGFPGFPFPASKLHDSATVSAIVLSDDDSEESLSTATQVPLSTSALPEFVTNFMDDNDDSSEGEDNEDNGKDCACLCPANYQC